MSQKSLSAPNKPRIAVAGATGRVGLALTNLLAVDPVDVVALTRRPDATRFPQGVAVLEIDFDRPRALAEALRGVDRLFVSHGTSSRQMANEIALIDGAIAAGVRQIVKLSALGPASRLNPLAWHMKIEARLAERPIASTVLRPSAFADILKRAGGDVAAGLWAGAAGDGRVNFIDTRDVADVARVALMEEFAPESQRAYHLTGPRTWTMHQVAEELSDPLGHPVDYLQRSPEERRTALLAEGLSTNGGRCYWPSAPRPARSSKSGGRNAQDLGHRHRRRKSGLCHGAGDRRDEPSRCLLHPGQRDRKSRVA